LREFSSFELFGSIYCASEINIMISHGNLCDLTSRKLGRSLLGCSILNCMIKVGRSSYQPTTHPGLWDNHMFTDKLFQESRKTCRTLMSCRHFVVELH